MGHPDFPGAAGYLNTASIGLPPASVAAAMRHAIDVWKAGEATAPGYDVYIARGRELWARLHGADPVDVSIGPQVSYFVGLIAQSLPAGSEVVSYDSEFASLVYPFLARGDLDVRLVPLEHVADAVRPGTALVAISAVQSSDGRVADLDAIAGAAAANGALTVVDGTQACGWLPLDATRFDFLVAAAYKWLLCPRGTAFMSTRPGLLETLTPWAAGWYSADRRWDYVYGGPLRLADDARRLDMSPAWLDWVGTVAALEYLERAGIGAIHSHDVGLANALRERLGMPQGDSAIVSVDGDDAPRTLTGAGLRVAGLAGNARICFHLYNDEDDVEAVARAFKDASAT